MTRTNRTQQNHRLAGLCLGLGLLLASMAAPAASTMIQPAPAAAPAIPAPTSTDPETLFRDGRRFFTQGDYARAVVNLEAAVKVAPDNPRIHHLLGCAYGRLAEQSNWFEALSLSRKTLKELKIAVKLDKNYVGALEDLMEYYQQAPGFLGGSEEKAQNIARRLELLEATGVSSKETQQELVDSPS